MDLESILALRDVAASRAPNIGDEWEDVWQDVVVEALEDGFKNETAVWRSFDARAKRVARHASKHVAIWERVV